MPRPSLQPSSSRPACLPATASPKANCSLPRRPGSTLRGHLWRFGFQVVDVDVSELGGAAIGLGPRAFALPWSQCMLDDALPTYATRRDELYRRLDEYAAKWRSQPAPRAGEIPPNLPP